MLITDLEKMETIVNSSPSLEWIGWDVVKYTKNNSAMYSADGVYRNGQWFKKKVYPLTNKGWVLPKALGRSDAGMEN